MVKSISILTMIKRVNISLVPYSLEIRCVHRIDECHQLIWQKNQNKIPPLIRIAVFSIAFHFVSHSCQRPRTKALQALHLVFPKLNSKVSIRWLVSSRYNHFPDPMCDCSSQALNFDIIVQRHRPICFSTDRKKSHAKRNERTNENRSFE